MNAIYRDWTGRNFPRLVGFHHRFPARPCGHRTCGRAEFQAKRNDTGARPQPFLPDCGTIGAVLGLGLFALATLVFLAVAMAAVVASVIWRWLRLRAGEIWFWLTYSVRCSWCKRAVHVAWVPLPYVRCRTNRTIKMPRVSHTICRRCASKWLEQV